MAQKKDPVATIRIRKDSIDYTPLFSDKALYRLASLTQFKGEQHRPGGQLFVYRYSDTTHNPILQGPKPANNDTLILLSWLQNKPFLTTERIKKFGKLRINTVSNTMLITFYEWEQPAKPPIKTTLLFKVLICTNQRLVLKDLSHLEYDRTYYFKRE